MSFPSKETIDRLRAEYPVGSRVELISMNDPYSTLRPGDKGRVSVVDDLQEHGLDSYDALREKTEAATARFNDLSGNVRALDAELKANAELQKHIVNYSKTSDTYAAYRKSGRSNKFRAEHESDIILHEASKKAFDDLGYGRDNRLPTVKMLRAAYAPALEEKKKANAEYRTAKAEMRELLLVKENVDRLLGTSERGRDIEAERTNL